MNVIYVREIEETSNIIKRIISKIKKILNIIKIENNDNNTIYYLPIYKNSKVSKYRTKKICKKIKKILEQNGKNTVALSRYLGNKQLLKNYLYSNNINILNGRHFFKYLIPNILEYIFKIKQQKMELRRSNYLN